MVQPPTWWYSCRSDGSAADLMVQLSTWWMRWCSCWSDGSAADLMVQPSHWWCTCRSDGSAADLMVQQSTWWCTCRSDGSAADKWPLKSVNQECDRVFINRTQNTSKATVLTAILSMVLFNSHIDPAGTAHQRLSMCCQGEYATSLLPIPTREKNVPRKGICETDSALVKLATFF